MASEVSLLEIEAIGDPDLQKKVADLLPDSEYVVSLSEMGLRRGGELQAKGFKPADALHLAAAEQSRVEVFLTCDDRLLRRAASLRGLLKVRVVNPLTWWQEQTHAQDQ